MGCLQKPIKQPTANSLSFCRYFFTHSKLWVSLRKLLKRLSWAFCSTEPTQGLSFAQKLWNESINGCWVGGRSINSTTSKNREFWDSNYVSVTTKLFIHIIQWQSSFYIITHFLNISSYMYTTQNRYVL